ncbi:hypothetical protein J6590_092475 [Homalodisca vitripennis]|nr:hypothetical protein J6590_092475 [Homalodisca vitripennis]
MADGRDYRLPRTSQRFFDEFCNRQGFSDDSDIGDLSDEDDPTFVIPPRIDDALQDDEDDDNDEGAAGINDDFEVLVFDQPSGNWEVTEIFDPLPPAPPFESNITDPEYVSSQNGWRRPL